MDVFSAFYGQRSVTAAWATRSPWSIHLNHYNASELIPSLSLVLKFPVGKMSDCDDLDHKDHACVVKLMTILQRPCSMMRMDTELMVRLKSLGIEDRIKISPRSY